VLRTIITNGSRRDAALYAAAACEYAGLLHQEPRKRPKNPLEAFAIDCLTVQAACGVMVFFHDRDCATVEHLMAEAVEHEKPMAFFDLTLHDEPVLALMMAEFICVNQIHDLHISGEIAGEKFAALMQRLLVRAFAICDLNGSLDPSRPSKMREEHMWNHRNAS
jgi:hypothetical protein